MSVIGRLYNSLKNKVNIWDIQRRLIRAGRTILRIWDNKIEKHTENLPPMYDYTRPMISFMLKKYNKASDLIGVEIGVDRGDNAAYILNILPIKRLFLIDPYLEYEEFKGNAGWENMTQAKFDEYFREAQKKVRYFKDRTEFIRKKSEDAADDILDNLDFVYLDGNHDYKFVKRDIELYYPKVKSGGVMGGDNFDPLFPGVPRAVLEFTDKYHLKTYGGRSKLSYEWWVVKE